MLLASAGMEPEERKTLVEGLMAVALTTAEMGHDELVFRQQAHETLSAYPEAGAHEVHDAADELRRFPQPPEYAVAERDRREFIDDMLGRASPEKQLAAMLTAREWLQTLEAELAAREP